MKIRYMFAAVALSFPLLGFATNSDVQLPKKIEMKDGSYIVLDTTDGTMSHYDSHGKPMKMAPGKLMEAKDGKVYEMRNNALWQRLWLRGTLKEPR